ncbi:response regulator [Nonomuraea typhae]|uniref:response regulator n=1 Tax=Nonomuraea typhae TaxID=2603600 RepID=UPI0012F84126|nr:response regulator transcription factor [Nonomuraea typhae]
MIRVLVVDDHEVVRQGLRFVLELQEDMEVAGECGNGTAALEMIGRLRPDVVLLDLAMPGVDGLAVLRELRGSGPAVIVLSSYDTDGKIVEAIREGAVSFLTKTVPMEKVVAAVRAAAGGEPMLEPDVAGLLMAEIRNTRPRDPLEALSPRERDVLVGIAKGRSNRELARMLTLSEETIKSHVSSILAKLHLTDRTQAAIFALRCGLVPLDGALDD